MRNEVEYHPGDEGSDGEGRVIEVNEVRQMTENG